MLLYSMRNGAAFVTVPDTKRAEGNEIAAHSGKQMQPKHGSSCDGNGKDVRRKAFRGNIIASFGSDDGKNKTKCIFV